MIIGIGANSVFQIPITDALLFGTILAATYPVAVDVIFKKFPIPHKLNLIIEGVVKGIIFSGITFSFLDASLLYGLW